MTDDDIRQRFPGVKFLHLPETDWYRGKVGWGVELDGRRNAWLFDDTPEAHEDARQKAVKWLEQPHGPTPV